MASDLHAEKLRQSFPLLMLGTEARPHSPSCPLQAEQNLNPRILLCDLVFFPCSTLGAVRQYVNFFQLPLCRAHST